MITRHGLRTDEDVVVAKLIEATRLRDASLADHGERTARIASAIGIELQLDAATRELLHIAGRLHDIGKLGVSEAILWKPTGLDRMEWAAMRSHPETGHRLVVDVVHPDVAAAVLYHHERIDGDGYPFGIDARTLPFIARIVQVADAFDAMTSERPYQSAVATARAVAEIGRCAGTQFDPDAAGALQRLFTGLDEDTIDLASAEGPSDPFTASGQLDLRDLA